MELADIFFCPTWEELPAQEIGRAVREMRNECGGTEAAAHRLGWDIAVVKSYISRAPLEDRSTAPLFCLTEADLRQHSPKRLEMMVKRATVRALAKELTSTHAIGNFIRKHSKYVSWLLAPESPGL